MSALQVGDARLPMREDAAHQSLTCNSRHVAHRYDVKRAAVEACMDCHNDTHTRAYEESPHHELWQQELDGELDAGSGVSCATCHMPRNEFCSIMRVLLTAGTQPTYFAYPCLFASSRSSSAS